MNKKDFIETLEAKLIRLPKADRDDILSDYENHFAEGLERGQSEEEVSAALGDPGELAATYLERLPAGAKGAPYVIQDPAPEESRPTGNPQHHNPQQRWAPTYGYQTPPPPPPPPPQPVNTQSTDNVGGIIAVIILSFIIVTGVIPTLFGLICGAFGGGVGIGVAAVGTFVGAIIMMAESVSIGLGLIFISVALVALSVLFIIAGIALCKLCWIVGKWYIGWCKKIVTGGNN